MHLISDHNRFWVTTCGCCETKGKCKRLLHDVCLFFRDDVAAPGTELREISHIEVNAISKEAVEKHLVFKPFRNIDNMAETDGICFCYDDCCLYFWDSKQKSDKGDLIEETDLNNCSNCGVCIDVCYSKAREIDDTKLIIVRPRVLWM